MKTRPSTNDATDVLTITFTLGGSAVGWIATVTGDDFITLDQEGNRSGANEVVYYNGHPCFK